MKKSTRVVTNVHGSMDVLKLFGTEQEEKTDKQRKKEKKKKKIEEKDLFYRCKINCVCNGACVAKKLKECPVCHKIKK